MKHRAVMWRPLKSGLLTQAEAAAQVAEQRERAGADLSALQRLMDVFGRLAQPETARFEIDRRFYS